MIFDLSLVFFSRWKWKEEFDGIWACASLLHVPRIVIGEVLERFFTALKSGWILFACLKEGSGERIVEDGRFFAYYGLEEFKRVLEGGSWRVIEATRIFGGDGRAWLNYLAQRVSPQAWDRSSRLSFKTWREGQILQEWRER